MTLNEQLMKLEANEHYEYVSPKTGNRYSFWKDEDFHNKEAYEEHKKDMGESTDLIEDWDNYANMVDLTVLDKDGNVIGDYLGCHLSDYDFDENTIDEDYLQWDKSLSEEEYDK